MAPVLTTRFSNIIASLTDVVSLLEKLDEACETPFLPAISATILSLIACVQDTKRNKEQSMRFMEDILDLLQVVVALHINAEPAGCLAPQTLDANMPLAVNLIAHLVDYEGSSAVLARWDNEKISLLSAGHDKRTNLEASIQISLLSSRFTAQPGAKDLLALLSTLPDGLSDVELLQMNLPIQNIRAARSTLLSTCLAYVDEAKRVRVLGPIREYVQKSSPPSLSLLRSPREYFGHLLNLYTKYWGTANPASHASGLASNLAHIHQTFQRELHTNNPDLAEAVRCVLKYSFFRHIHGYGRTDLLPQVEVLLPQACDDHLEIEYITRVLLSYMYYPVSEPELLIKRGLELLPNLTDPQRKCQFYRGLGIYYCYHRNDFSLSKQFLAKGTYCGEVVWFHQEPNQYAQEARKLAHLSGDLYAEAQALFLSVIAAVDGNLTHRILMLDRARDFLRLCNISGGSLDNNILAIMALTHRTSAEQDPFNHACCLIAVVEINLGNGQIEHSDREALSSAKSICQMLHYPTGNILCDLAMSSLQLNDGDVTGAYAKLKQCVSSSWGKNASVVSDSYLDLDHHVPRLGDYFLTEEDEETARNIFAAVLDGFTQMDIHQGRARCMLRLGDMLER
ncbi:hypothetical protein B0H16DRAFT_1821550 [Mycena metata]|uniref:Uncharacterized protein n=1 Tax=Mycena metata TaxID=1033252 RepID=A0AAD7JAN8_9AGAR|nr:hypothetical protein B0H16DRAFT_1821550 [Mycena metata]